MAAAAIAYQAARDNAARGVLARLLYTPPRYRCDGRQASELRLEFERSGYSKGKGSGAAVPALAAAMESGNVGRDELRGAENCALACSKVPNSVGPRTVLSRVRKYPCSLRELHPHVPYTVLSDTAEFSRF